MNKIIMKFGSTIMMLALVATKLNVNATCSHYIYQGKVPSDAMKLSKYK